MDRLTSQHPLANGSLQSISTWNYSYHTTDTDDDPAVPLYPSLSSEAHRDSLYIVIPVTIIYASIFVTGTIGNISTCIVIARNKSMHTATNYYLFSLAVSDLLLLVSGLPAEIYLVWCKYPYIFGEGFCVIRGLAAETSTNATVLTITAFTIERYLAICHPFLSQTMSKLSRAVKLILVIWLVALSFALPQALQFGVVRHERIPSLVVCTVKRIVLSHSFELSTFLFFVVPMCLITVLYALIGLRLRKSNMMKRNPGRNQLAKNSRVQSVRSSQRVLKMLVAVVIAFFICWAPFHVQRLVAIYGTDTDDHISSNSKRMELLYMLMTYISGVLYYVSTTINPILYNIMSNKFRVAFMETLSRSCRPPGFRIRNEQRSYSSLSRSQQRTVGGSRIVVNGPIETSRNSDREETTKQLIVPDRASLDNPSSSDGRNQKDGPVGGYPTAHQYYDGKSGGKSCLRSRYATVRVPSLDESGKRWWRILKRLPGLRSLRLGGGCAVRERDRPNVREELSMTMWNVYETTNDPRPI